MTGLKSIVLTLLALSCLTALAESHRRTLHWWNPITWLREKEDRRLATSVKHFFSSFFHSPSSSFIISFQLVEAKSLSAKQLTLIEGSSATEAASSSSAMQVSVFFFFF